MHQTYIKVKGVWMCQYRAVDKEGNTIDSYFAKNRNQNSAIKFFMRSMCNNGKPRKVNIDKSGANTSALNAINKHCQNQNK